MIVRSTGWPKSSKATSPRFPSTPLEFPFLCKATQRGRVPKRSTHRALLPAYSVCVQTTEHGYVMLLLDLGPLLTIIRWW